MTDENVSKQPVTVLLKMEGSDDNNSTKRLKAEWSLGNRLLVADVCSKPPGNKKGNSVIHDLVWNTSMHNKYARKLISESSGVFLSLQSFSSTAESSSDVSIKKELVKISHKYRSIIKAMIEDMQAVYESTLDTDSLKDSIEEKQSQIFFKIELIWNLCEIMFIDLKPGGAFMVMLLDWLRWHFHECETTLKEVMESEEPSRHISYWEVVYKYLLQGRIQDVKTLLLLDSDSNSYRAEYSAMDFLLRKMPYYTLYSSSPISEFEFQWHQWHEECNLKLERGVFRLTPKLEKMCMLLCGQMDTFKEFSNLCETWYHAMVSHLFFTNPFVKATDLCSLVHEYIQVFGSFSALTELDRIILACFEFNVLEVIKESSECLGDWWFVAHFTDLLHHAGHLNTTARSDGGMSLREFLLLEYATGLASHCSMWQFAVDYFDHCPTCGMQYLESFLERIPVETEYKAQKVLDVAVQRNMSDFAFSFCKHRSRKALGNGMIGTALLWALKCKDVDLTNHIAERILTEYTSHDEFSTISFLDNLGPSIVISNKLTFLCKYREFYNCFARKQFQRAANVLVALLSSKLAPKSFWPTLLIDAVPLLESKEHLYFDADQTYEMLFFLEELTPIAGLEMEKSNDPTQCSKNLDVVRLAAMRNLARAFAQNQ